MNLKDRLKTLLHKHIKAPFLPQAQKEIHQHNYVSMGSNSMPETVMSFGLLIAVIWATPIEKKFSSETYTFLFFTLVLSAFRLLLIQYQSELIKNRLGLWCKLFIGGALVSAISWGTFQHLF